MSTKLVREFKGVWIPKEVLFDKSLGLKFIEKGLLIEISSLQDEKKGCYASNQHFSDLFDVSPARCSQIIKKLAQLDLITVSIQTINGCFDERNIYLTEFGDDFLKGGLKPAKGGLKPAKGGLKKTQSLYRDTDKNNNLENKEFPYGNIPESLRSSDNESQENSSKQTPPQKEGDEISPDTLDTTIPSTPQPKSETCAAPPPPAPATPKEIKHVYPEMDGVYDHIIEYWNACAAQDTSKIMTTHSKPQSKAWNFIAYCLDSLVRGDFYKKFDVDFAYCQKNSIGPNFIRKKYTADEIKQIIGWYLMGLKPDLGSRYKTKYPKSFADFLFNQTTKTSFFMSCAAKGEPQPWCEEPLDQKVVNMYHRELMQERVLNPDEKKALHSGVNFIIRQRKEYHDRIGQYGTPSELQDNKFYKTHIKFMRDQYLDKGVFNVTMIRNSNIFSKFSVWLKEFYGKNYDLYPSASYTETKRRQFEERQREFEISEKARLEEEAIAKKKWEEHEEQFRRNNPSSPICSSPFMPGVYA